MGSRTTWLWLFVASLGVTALLGVMALLTPGVPFQEELLGTSGLLTAYSLLGLVASLAIARARSYAVIWTAIGCLAVSLLIWLGLIWFDAMIPWDTVDDSHRCAVTALVFGVLGIHGTLLPLVRIKRRLGKAVRLGTIVAACAGAVLALGIMWDVGLPLRDDLLARIAAAFLIPAALGTIAVPVLARIEFVGGAHFDADSLDRFVPVFIRCPRCALEQTVPANRKNRCDGCGLEAMISFTEPRCVCGYLLYGLPEPTCPECGRDVPVGVRWGASGVSDGPEHGGSAAE